VAGHGVVLVDALDGDPGQEVLTANGLEGRPQARVVQQPLGRELVDQPLVKLCRHRHRRLEVLVGVAVRLSR
jgi:hypothetical protein